MASLMNSNTNSFIVVDCRFNYEYQGGHIKGAINMSTQDQMRSYFFKTKENIVKIMGEKVIIVFHCEFS